MTKEGKKTTKKNRLKQGEGRENSKEENFN